MDGVIRDFIRDCKELVEGLTEKVDKLIELNKQLEEEIYQEENKDRQ